MAGEHTHSTFRSGANTTQFLFRNIIDGKAVYLEERRAFLPSLPTVLFSSEITPSVCRSRYLPRLELRRSFN